MITKTQKTIEVTTIIVPRTRREPIYNVELTASELFALRGLAWNNGAVLTEIVRAHQAAGALITDGPTERRIYDVLLRKLWDETNPIRNQLADEAGRI